MKYIALIFLFFSGCAAFEHAMNTAQVAVPPLVDVFSPGLGTTIGAIIGGVSVIGGGISTWIIKKKRNSKNVRKD